MRDASSCSSPGVRMFAVGGAHEVEQSSSAPPLDCGQCRPMESASGITGEARVWVRTPRWARPLSLRELYNLPADEYFVAAVDLDTLGVRWCRITQLRLQDGRGKRCFRILLERGHELVISNDHSVFSIDPVSARIVPVRGCDIEKDAPVIVPFDLSSVVGAWEDDLCEIDLSGLAKRAGTSDIRWPIIVDDTCLTNRLCSTRVSIRFSVTDDFLYVVGLWLAEGGKSIDSRTSSLAFSVGGIPGAVNTLLRLFGSYGISVSRSSNGYDCSISSSVFAAIFQFLGLFGTAKRGEKRFPEFFWSLSQRQRRIVVAGLWDGDGSRVFKGQAVLAQKSHSLVEDVVATLLLDGVFPIVNKGPNSQLRLYVNRTHDFRGSSTDILCGTSRSERTMSSMRSGPAGTKRRGCGSAKASGPPSATHICPRVRKRESTTAAASTTTGYAPSGRRSPRCPRCNSLRRRSSRFKES